MDESWLSAVQVAAIVGMSPKTVRNWARSGRLPGVRFGGRDWKFRASDIASAFTRALPQVAVESTPHTRRRREHAPPVTISPAAGAALPRLLSEVQRRREVQAGTVSGQPKAGRAR